MNRNWGNQKQSTLKTKIEINKMQIDKIQLVQMANRVGSYSPKGGHSATKPKLKV